MFTPSARADDTLLDAIEHYLERLESHVNNGSSQIEFFNELTQGLIRFCSADAVGVWIADDQRPQLIMGSGGYQSTLPEALFKQTSLASGKLLPRIEVLPCTDTNPALTRLLSIGRFHATTAVVLDVWGISATGAVALETMHELVRGVTELATSLLLRTRLDHLQQCVSQQETINLLLRSTQNPGSFAEGCHTIATTLLTGLERDRVSIFQITSTGARLLAATPATMLHAKSSQLVQLNRLATAIAADAGWLSIRVGDGWTVSPGIKQAVEPYLQDSLAREVWGFSSKLLLQDSGQTVHAVEGVIILERFTLHDAHDGPLDLKRIAESSRVPSATQAQNQLFFRETLLHNGLSALRLLLSTRNTSPQRLLDQWRASSFLRRLIAFLATGLALLFLLFLIPAKLTFIVEGSLQPKSARTVFATRDGVVENLYIGHGAVVKEGQPLLEIRSPELDLEYQSLQGQIDTLTAKLMSLRSSKTKQGNDRASEQAQRLSAEEEDLKIQLLGLRKQWELVKGDREGLTLASPLAGQVDGWEIEQTLPQRPVAQGERLFQIFTPDAGWQVELEIPDQIAGYVAEAQRSGPCPVEFRIRSDPAKSHQALLSFLSETTQVTAAQKAVVFAKVDLAKANIRATRSGARVVARIDCGRSTLGYTWLRETLEFLQRSFWF